MSAGGQSSRRSIGFCAGALAAAGLVAAAGVTLAQGLTFNPNHPIRLSPAIPADVNPAIRTALLARGDILLAHRMFEQQQWAVFVALNWPVDDRGKLRKSLASRGQPRWARWIETYQVFKPDGAAPDVWDGAKRSLPLAGSVQVPMPSVAAGRVPFPAVDSRSARVLHNRSSIRKLNVADEVDQAFSFAIWDQNGQVVHYESLLNRVEYDFIVANKLYEAGGLAAYVAKVGKLKFPAGKFAGNRVGAIEIKLAWRVLDPAKDDFSRYLTQHAYVASGPGKPTWKQAVVGLVGFHIAQKTETSPQWIWSTFEHVDNLAVDRLKVIKTADGTRRALRPSFNDADCEWCPVNVPSPPGPDGKRRTQITRLVPIPRETAALNARMRALLAKAGSKLQYYEMIGTQWPTDPAAAPEAGAAFPGAVVNRSGGKPLPAYLANSVMETFSQVGNRPANEQPRAVSTSRRPVFGNGSCIGCHASSPYDFSWIMTKAQARR